LPSEVLQVILRNIGGCDFTNFKRASKRSNSVANDLERRSKPSVWKRFVFQDFLRPCIECLAPWISSSDDNDLILWKGLYIRLYRTSILKGKTIFVSKKLTYSEGAQLVNDVKFFYNHLFLIISPKLGNFIHLADRMRRRAHMKSANPESQLPCCDLILSPASLVIEGASNSDIILRTIEASCPLQEELPETGDLITYVCLNHAGDFSKGAFMSVWGDTCIIYRRECLYEEKDIRIFSYKHSSDVDLIRTISLKTSLIGVVSLAYNEDRVVVVCTNRIICLFENASAYIVPVFQYTMSKEPLKVKMLGDFIIVLFDDGDIETTHVLTSDVMTLADWQQLDLSELEETHCPILKYSLFRIMDIILQGHLFAFITDFGFLFISYLDSLDHECLVRNLQHACDVPLNPDGFVSRMTVDQEDGLKFAVVERFYNVSMWVSAVHVISIDLLQ
ncbi:unnamed protein product, partial [Lymnaea stagnalis]